MDALLAALQAMARQVLLVFGPLVLVTAALRLIERALATRLASRLGWHSVLFTAWLGVPVHEISHAAACLLFGHRVQRLRLLAPDATTGQLGSVDHAWNRRSLYQQVGRFFIGVAPLAGGALVLWMLTFLIGPPAQSWPTITEDGGVTQSLQVAGRQAFSIAGALLSVEAAGDWLTWLYLYLCLCIGAHMSPSSADLRGGLPGLALLLALVLVANLVVVLVGGNALPADHLLLVALTPLLALLFTALVLDVLCLVAVALVTALLPRRAA